MKTIIAITTFLLLFSSCNSSNNKTPISEKTNPISNKACRLSVELIHKSMKHQPTAKIQQALANLPFDSLLSGTATDRQKLVFWINVYNSNIQIQLQQNPDLYKDRDTFFNKKSIEIAGKKLSFDQIENGILRRSAFKYSLGYIHNPFADKLIKQLQCKKEDERIHFALNCGAKSCPPLHAYTIRHFDKEINNSAKTFLQSVSHFDKEKEEVVTTPLFQWFKGDFDGGAIPYLKQYKVIQKESKPTVKYGNYDWTLSLY